MGNCAWHKSLTPQEPTEFLRSAHVPTTSKLASLPFSHSWLDPKINAGHYAHLVIRPVLLHYLREDHWRRSISTVLVTREQYRRHARDLAAYWDRSLARSFNEPTNRLRPTADTKAPGTLVAEIAITDIVFSHPDTYALSWTVLGGVLVEGAMLAPSVAFEAIIRDAKTGKVVATCADHRGTKLKLFDINRLTISSPNHEICDEWSQQLMQALNRRMFPVVRRDWIGVF